MNPKIDKLIQRNSILIDVLDKDHFIEKIYLHSQIYFLFVHSKSENEYFGISNQNPHINSSGLKAFNSV